ncbi:uncharacterized protein LOC115888033 [Sitophilus oryzae]|uniref:Uncharacterized protein LOC115888033 n=1 Tax=Sitophilus oryzae TaxID=7048 RepID=A0A6J2YJK5_SITOR|nr:uncharacterized protein LOC115888033 [Sitophilus oryzae]
MVYRAVVLGICAFASAVWAQDCRFYGQTCSDDYDCCGGCCFKGSCTDTYLDCRLNSLNDPCQDRYCPEDQVCVTYQPRGCKGCGYLIDCRSIPVPPELKKNRTLTHHHRFSSAHSTHAHFNHIFLYITVVIYFYLI